MLINISSLLDRARAAGFRVYGGATYAEMFAPDHTGPDTVWSGDSQYSTCTIVLTDRPGIGYGYNPMFYGPWHHGMTPSDASGVRKLLNHPAMQIAA